MSADYVQLINWSQRREPGKRRPKEDFSQVVLPKLPLPPPDIGDHRILDDDEGQGRIRVQLLVDKEPWAEVYLPKGTPFREILTRVQSVLRFPI